MKSTQLDSYLQNTQQEAQKLYAYWQTAGQSESPQRLLTLFRLMFIEARECEDLEVRLALENIVKSKQAEQDFPFILNYCCYIIINHCYNKLQLESVVLELIGSFEQAYSPKFTDSNSIAHLKDLVKKFTQTERYIKLKRLGRILGGSQTTANSLGDLIGRYPFLYQDSLLIEDSSYEERRIVKKIQRRGERDFEEKISQYIIYQLRFAREQRSHSSDRIPQNTLQKYLNPTLLRERALGKSLKHFVAQVEGNDTYHDLAKKFLTLATQTSSYQIFKDDLYKYLISSVDPQYGQQQFNQKLWQKLQNILPERNQEKPNEFLLVRTCSYLFDFLVADTKKQLEHYVLIDLISNIGIIKTIGLLLKLVLLSPQVKPSLEKRFSLLFCHYEACNPDEVPWLVKALETLNLAFCVNLSKTNFSYLRKMF